MYHYVTHLFVGNSSADSYSDCTINVVGGERPADVAPRVRQFAHYTERSEQRTVAGPFVNQEEALIWAAANKPHGLRCGGAVATMLTRTPLWDAAWTQIESHGYHTPSSGNVRSHRGSATIEWAGRRWTLRGFGPQGTPEFLLCDGGVECRSDRGERFFV